MIQVDHVISGALALAAAIPAGIWLGRWIFGFRTRPRLLVSLIIGLVALGIVAWVALGTLAIAYLKSDSIPSAIASTPTSTQTEGPKLDRYYSANEKEKLAEIIATVMGILNSEGLGIAADTYEAAEEPKVAPSKASLQALLTRVDGARRRSSQIHQAIWDELVVKNQANFAVLAKLFGDRTAITNFQLACNEYYNAYESFIAMFDQLGGEERGRVENIIWPQRQKLRAASDDWRNWIIRRQSDIDVLRQALR
jgi:hypothetical protein